LSLQSEGKEKKNGRKGMQTKRKGEVKEGMGGNGSAVERGGRKSWPQRREGKDRNETHNGKI